MEINFGSFSLVDLGRGSDDVFSSNTALDALVPNGVPSGPISVATLGGESAAFELTFASIVSTANTGTATNVGVASANPGQAITLQGTNFDLTTDVVFEVIDSSGNRSEEVVRPLAVNDEDTEIIVETPIDAVTGVVRIVGDQNATEAILQIVPTIDFVDLTSVTPTTASFTLSGSGFIEGSNSLYMFGSESLTDMDISTSEINVFSNNTRSSVSIAYSEGLFGAVTVTTEGGTSDPFTVGFTQIDSVALSGTPADSTEASANAGQVIVIQGAG